MITIRISANAVKPVFVTVAMFIPATQSTVNNQGPTAMIAEIVNAAKPAESVSRFESA